MSRFVSRTRRTHCNETGNTLRCCVFRERTLIGTHAKRGFIVHRVNSDIDGFLINSSTTGTSVTTIVHCNSQRISTIVVQGTRVAKRCQGTVNLGKRATHRKVRAAVRAAAHARTARQPDI